MAENTIWKSIDTMPENRLVIVHNDFQGYALRSVTDDGEFYDENDVYDDGDIEWDLWTWIPAKPGPRVED